VISCAILILGVSETTLIIKSIKLKFGVDWAVGFVGIMTFFVMLAVAHGLSHSKYLDRGEIRKAIVASFLAVYFSILSVLTFSKVEYDKSIMDGFTSLVGAIVLSYFITRPIEKIKGGSH